MAPPRNPNPSFPKFGFEPFYVTVTEPGTGKTHTYTDYRPVSGRDPVTGRDYNYDILTDDVLNNGNLEVLNDFYKAQVKTQLQRTIMDAIQTHRSPVAIAWDAYKEAHPVRTGEEILKNSKSVSVLQI